MTFRWLLDDSEQAVFLDFLMKKLVVLFKSFFELHASNWSNIVTYSIKYLERPSLHFVIRLAVCCNGGNLIGAQLKVWCVEQFWSTILGEKFGAQDQYKFYAVCRSDKNCCVDFVKSNNLYLLSVTYSLSYSRLILFIWYALQNSE